ncbi:MAG: hypothetical protein PT977_09055 [Acidobacteriota bacterium]|nr:hypothetical protein [Acidobacteriota bacterium]
MKKLLYRLALGTFVTLIGAASAPVYAQSDRENSTFTVTEPINVGGVILQPGTYLIKVVLLASNRNMIQVTNEDQTKVFATVLATPHPIGTNEAIPSSRYVYYATAAGQPKALRTWFARDTTNGQDIIYPKRHAMELAAVAKEPVIAIPDETKEADYKSVSLTVVTPAQEMKPYEEPAPPVLLAEARPAKPLPPTASRVPLFAALGMLSLAGAFALRVIANRAA